MKFFRGFLRDFFSGFSPKPFYRTFQTHPETKALNLKLSILGVKFANTT
jgi:hypothetical protein